MQPTDSVIVVATAAILTGAAILACAWPAFRAAHVDPATLLREE